MFLYYTGLEKRLRIPYKLLTSQFWKTKFCNYFKVKNEIFGECQRYARFLKIGGSGDSSNAY